MKTLPALLRRLLPLLALAFFCVSPAFGQTPAAPTNATLSVVNHTTIGVQWTDSNPSTYVAGYYIYVYEDYNYLGRATVAANSSSCAITVPTPDIYTVLVVAYTSSGTLSAPSQSNDVTLTESLARYGFQGTAGQALSGAVLSPTSNAGSGAPLSSLTVTGLPSWLTYTSATKTFTGTPPAVGAYPVTVTATYSDTYSFTSTVTIRVLPATAGPVAVGTMPSPTLTPNTTPTTIDLSTLFSSPDTPQAVCIATNLGNINVILYPATTPATVTNFLSYANATGQAGYANTVINRSVPGFVIQGGGFKPAGGNAFTSVTTSAAITNEPGLSNVLGTIAMARTSTVNSATDQWFINLADNSSNLDYQNQGFTVFGRVGQSSMAVANAIAALPVGDYTSVTVGGTADTGDFTNCPMNAASAPATMNQSELVTVSSVSSIQPLTYQVVSNSLTAAVQTSISANILTLTPTNGGTATLDIRATDLDGNTLDRMLTVQVQWTYATWAAQQTFTSGASGLTSDPNNDGLVNLLKYALLTSPKVASPSPTSVSKVANGGKNYLALTFPMRLGASDLTYYVQASSTLASGSWTNIWNSTQGSGGAQVQSWVTGTDRDTVTIRDTTAITSGTRRFLRLYVVE